MNIAQDFISINMEIRNAAKAIAEADFILIAAGAGDHDIMTQIRFPVWLSIIFYATAAPPFLIPYCAIIKGSVPTLVFLCMPTLLALRNMRRAA